MFFMLKIMCTVVNNQYFGPQVENAKIAEWLQYDVSKEEKLWALCKICT